MVEKMEFTPPFLSFARIYRFSSLKLGILILKKMVAPDGLTAASELYVGCCCCFCGPLHRLVIIMIAISYFK